VWELIQSTVGEVATSIMEERASLRP